MVATASTTSAENPNSPLHNHPSAYLAMHANDPVHWQLWSNATLNLAHTQNKLIIVSSGYFSCHWCHVMQKEIYQDSEVAAQINQTFIAIKVDRELQPEQDLAMTDFARKITGKAGWPQHVIYTPNGDPFAAFTYLPKADLQAYLTKVDKLWKSQANYIQKLAKQSQSTTSQTESFEVSELKAKLYDSLPKQMDDFSGGLQGTHKFPNSPLLISLLKQQDLPQAIQDWLMLTLQQMQSQHLHDHVNGGFYRYTVDPEWQTPHFEKMLYDNAQLLQVYLLAAEKWPEEDFLNTAESTFAYLQNNLYEPNLQLYRGSQSALDKHGSEGGDYLWSKSELKSILNSDEFAQIVAEWNLESTPPYELGWHPKPTQRYWQSIQKKLRNHRNAKEFPTDNKAIIAWNALLLIALQEAENRVFNPQQYPNLAAIKNSTKSLRQILTRLINQGNLHRAYAWHQDQATPLNPITLEEVSSLTQALLMRQTKITQNEQNALSLLNTYQKDFKSGEVWQYQQTSSLANNAKPVRFKDTEVPNPSALLNCLKMVNFASTVGPNTANKAPLLQGKPIALASYLSHPQCAFLTQ